MRGINSLSQVNMYCSFISEKPLGLAYLHLFVVYCQWNYWDCNEIQAVKMHGKDEFSHILLFLLTPVDPVN